MQSNIEDGWKTFNEIISHQLYNKRDKGVNNDLQNTETSSNTSPSKNCVVISGVPEGSATVVTPVVLLLTDSASTDMEIVLGASMRK